MKLTVDRLEGGFAVCENENGDMVNVPLAALPDVREGDVLKVEKDPEARAALEKEIRGLMDSVWE